ncbi:MAG: hypothetical protein VB102_13640 [Paludibacter sp.]|nr:hypothetical protein [Paludibacter sp.]
MKDYSKIISIIIDIIDDELISQKKDFITLKQANKLLIQKEIIIDDSNMLKNLLEDNRLPHAYQTETSPVQWRIPLSSKGKRKRTNKQRIVVEEKQKEISKKLCPKCGADWDNAIFSGNVFQCPTCGFYLENGVINESNEIKPILEQSSINNSNLRIDNEEDKHGKSRFKPGCLISVLVFVIILILINNNNNSNQVVRNNPFNSSVSQVKDYLKNDYLADPGSYESIEWSEVQEVSGKEYSYYVRHKYRAKNSYGGYVVANQLFFLDENGDVVAVEDYD